jgi:hypothetical protein
VVQTTTTTTTTTTATTASAAAPATVVREQHPADPGCRSGLRWIAGPVNPSSCTAGGVGCEVGGKVREECCFTLEPRDWCGNLCPYRDEAFSVTVSGPERCRVKATKMSDPAFPAAAAALGFRGPLLAQQQQQQQQQQQGSQAAVYLASSSASVASSTAGGGGSGMAASDAGLLDGANDFGGSAFEQQLQQLQCVGVGGGAAAASTASRSRSRSRSRNRSSGSGGAGSSPGGGGGFSSLPQTLADVIELSTAVTHDVHGRLLAPSPPACPTVGFKASFRPTVSGSFTISCLLGGHHVKGSQFTVLVVPFTGTETFTATSSQPLHHTLHRACP